MDNLAKNSFKFFFMSVLIFSVQCQDPLYTITAPKSVQPNSPYHVVVTVHHAPEPVEVEATLESLKINETEKVSKKETVQSGETKKIELNIGSWNSHSSQLRVTGSGGISFNKTENVFLRPKTSSVFIQTDKAIYQPGQIVHFRVISINSSLQAQNPDAMLYINDAKRNRIKQWQNISFVKGVFSGDLQLSDQVVFGDWEIVVPHNGNQVTKKISVAEYVLPTFEVDTQLPSFATFAESDVVVTVVAKYTYGKPVKGDVILNVNDYYCQPPCLSSNVKPLSLKSSINGSAEMKINLVRDLQLPDWYRYGRNRLQFSASVTEALTGRQQNSSNSFYLYQDKYKLSFETTGSFKPGLTYLATLKVLYQDDLPVTDDLRNLSIKYKYSWSDDEKNLTFSDVKNGIVTIELVPPESATMIRLEASFKDAHAYETINKAQSLSERYIQVSLMTQNPKVGDEVKLHVNSTKILNDALVLEVVGRGKVLHMANIPGSKTTTQTIEFPLSQNMAPKVRAIVYYATACGEVVADALDFGVEGFFRTPVSIDVHPNETKPGSAIEVSVKTNPHAFVGLSAIDQSVLLLKTGNDITEEEVLTDMQDYEIGDRPPIYYDGLRRTRSYIVRPWRPRSSSTIELFENVGLIFFTNGLLARWPMNSYGGYGGGGVNFHMQELDVLRGPGAPVAMAAPAPRPPGAGGFSPSRRPELMEPTRVRQFFPESFLWINETAGENGIVNIKADAPDTITSYFINAFAIDEEDGLGLAASPTKMQIFRPFFVTLNLPYSVVRGETLALQALVFNYMKEDIQAEVTLDNGNDDFDFVDLENEVERNSKEKQMTKTVNIKAGDGSTVFFYIAPKKLGHLDLAVTARSTVAADALLRKLLVKAEGLPVYLNKAVLIDLRDKPMLEEKVVIDFPQDIVADSERIEISAINDIMGATINNLDKLLRMPYGCGEQNMLNFVPNIVITNYLTGTNQLTPELKEKVTRYMESGYQRELTYKRYDGSFSAFGSSDKSGSTWLTAFVVKSFIQAKKYITIDDTVIQRSLDWLSQHQMENGSFPEVGTVFHKAMQGGSSQGLGLTAYVFSAFLESNLSSVVRNEKTDAIIAKSLSLIQNLDEIESDYDLVFITYVLHLANSPAKEAAFQKMNAHAKTEGDLKYWSVPLPEVNQSDPFAYYNRPRSVDVEMTAYALLVYTLRNLTAEGVPIMKWLVSKQNENGGFESTQDTVIGIQALAHYAAKLGNPLDSNINVHFSYAGGEKDMILSKENALVLHREKLPSTVREVDITANGKGTSVMQVTWSYNVPTTPPRPTFEVETNSVNDRDLLTVESCTKYAYSNEDNDNESNMAVMEVAFPSGYTADRAELPELNEEKQIKRVETKDGDSVVVIYFDKIGKKVCTVTKAHRNNKVADLKPALVKVYDYYDPAKRGDKFYDAPKTALCDLCETSECKEKCK